MFLLIKYVCMCQKLPYYKFPWCVFYRNAEKNISFRLNTFFSSDYNICY